MSKPSSENDKASQWLTRNHTKFINKAVKLYHQQIEWKECGKIKEFEWRIEKSRNGFI